MFGSNGGRILNLKNERPLAVLPHTVFTEAQEEPKGGKRGDEHFWSLQVKKTKQHRLTASVER